jgi:hypothetical protein
MHLWNKQFTDYLVSVLEDGCWGGPSCTILMTGARQLMQTAPEAPVVSYSKDIIKALLWLCLCSWAVAAQVLWRDRPAYTPSACQARAAGTCPANIRMWQAHLRFYLCSRANMPDTVCWKRSALSLGGIKPTKGFSICTSPRQTLSV